MTAQTQETRTWRGELAAWIATGLAAGATAWAADGARTGLVLGGTILGLALVVHLGRNRSDALKVISGVGDERTATLYTRATAGAGTTMWVVLPVWYAVTVVRGEPQGILLTLWAIWGIAFVVSAVVESRRG